MSILVDGGRDHVLLFCKGADSFILSHLDESIQQPFLEKTKEEVYNFSSLGLRTLCYGVRAIKRQVFEEWKHKYAVVNEDPTLSDKEHRLIEL